MDFPEIPKAAIEPFIPCFLPAPKLAAWVRGTFIQKDSPLCNEDHKHLRLADVRFLWTNVTYVDQGRNVLGTCQFGKPGGASAWSKGQRAQQIEEWFGTVPTFMIILSAPFCAGADMMSICALIEHELYHAGQAKNEFGFPKYSKDGIPKWAIRGHDVEEFVGVADRYGIGNVHHAALRQLAAASNREPSIGRAKVDGVCGCCLRKVG